MLDVVETVIEQNAVLEGIIKTDKIVRIDGQVKGNINDEGGIIGEKAEITGDIDTNIIMIGDLVKGNINASETMEVLLQVKVFGDIKTNVLTAHFYGKSSMAIKETNNGAEMK